MRGRRLAVCSWSLQPDNLTDLLAKLKPTGLNHVQLALDPLREAPEAWHQVSHALNASELTLVSGMFGCIGEDYSTLESIRLTGGVAPDSTWGRNLQNIRLNAQLAADFGLKLVTFHAGFLPEDPADPNHRKMLDRLTQVAELFAEKNINLALETGQESAPVLADLLQQLRLPNLGVNFDPANMILYDKGDPVEALRILGPWIRQVHLKDAKRTLQPGTWGEEVAVGDGQVNWNAFFATLKQLGYTGHFVIEREAGAQRIADICRAREIVLNLI